MTIENPLSVSVISPIENDAWTNFIDATASATIYHTSEWIEAIAKTYSYIPICFILENTTGEIIGGLPGLLVKSLLTGKRLVSLSFSDHCEILAQQSAWKKILFDYASNFAKLNDCSLFELRSQLPPEKTSEFLRGFMQKVYNLHILDLQKPLEEIWDGFHKNYIKRNIRKSLANDLTICTSDSIESLKIFYKLHSMTRKKHNLPVQPLAFFRNILNLNSAKTKAEILFADTGNKHIAGLLLLRHKSTMHYLYGGTDPEFINLRPNHFLIWNAIKRAHEEGMKYFDFGRSDTNNSGLRNFKQAWGTVESKVYTYCYPGSGKSLKLINRNKPEGTGLMSKFVLKHIPVFIWQYSGKILYKHLG